MATVVEIDYTDETTPVMPSSCPTCGRTYLPLKETHPEPQTYAQAWSPPVICRGTPVWHWCKQTGDVTFPGTKRVVLFPDRRSTPRV